MIKLGVKKHESTRSITEMRRMLREVDTLFDKEYIDTAISSYERRCDERDTYRYVGYILLKETKNLKEEHKNLKEETKNLKEEHEKMKNKLEKMEEEHKNLKEEHKNLEEEHEKMKNKLEKMEEIMRVRENCSFIFR